MVNFCYPNVSCFLLLVTYINSLLLFLGSLLMFVADSHAFLDHLSSYYSCCWAWALYWCLIIFISPFCLLAITGLQQNGARFSDYARSEDEMICLSWLSYLNYMNIHMHTQVYLKTEIHIALIFSSRTLSLKALILFSSPLRSSVTKEPTLFTASNVSLILFIYSYPFRTFLTISVSFGPAYRMQWMYVSSRAPGVIHTFMYFFCDC